MNDNRRDYGEQRIIAIGEVDGLVLVVAYTDRNGTAGFFGEAGESEGA